MSIFVVGINHKTAPVTLREKAYFSLDKLSLYLQDLLTHDEVDEAVLLSTCNRSELYCVADHMDLVWDWFCAQVALPRHEIEPVLYVYRDEEAVAHIMQVACGLDSMILGEPQILGQMKEAFTESCTAGTVGPLFHRLFQQLFAVVKEIRTTTAIGACPVSVASAAVHFAKQQYPLLAQANVALIGAGDTAQLLMRYLKTQLTEPLLLVNRNVEKASALAAEMRCQIYGLDQLISVLMQADIVFSATGSAAPLISKALMTEVMSKRATRPIIILDVAVPLDVDPAVSELEGVLRYCIDDLKAIIERNRQGREHAAFEARKMIQHKSILFIEELKSHDKVTHAIRAYRGQIEEICHHELLKAKQQLQQGVEPSQVLDMFACAFTKKLLHAPSVQLRQAGAAGRFDLLRFAKQLFAIPDSEIERL